MKKILMSLIAAFGLWLNAAADSAPAYPGGDTAMQKYIADNMKYPAPAQRNGIEGVVTVEATILANGSVGTIKIVRMIDPDLEQEAIRLVKNMPAWKPAEKGGTATDAVVTIPVTFTLPE